MPTRSFCSETHQSARCLIGSERWESIAICTPAPKSSLWTCHSRRIACSCLVLHLTKGSPISGGRKKLDTQHSYPVSQTFTRTAAQTEVDICSFCTLYYTRVEQYTYKFLKRSFSQITRASQHNSAALKSTSTKTIMSIVDWRCQLTICLLLGLFTVGLSWTIKHHQKSLIINIWFNSAKKQTKIVILYLHVFKDSHKYSKQIKNA